MSGRLLEDSVQNVCQLAVAMAMEPSRVWKNLLSGKQAVPTVACPSCGAQVPEFRIHSHLDTCLTTLPSEEDAGIAAAAAAAAAAGEVVHELSDEERNRHRRGRARGQGRGRGRGRKRREGAEIKKGRDGDTDGRKRARGDNVECDKGFDAPAFSDGDDDDANFYQHWEYSVSGFDELAKSRKVGPLSDLQKQELLASGVLTFERHEVSAMVLELDRLLAGTEGAAGVSSMSMPRFRSGNGFQIPAMNQVGVPEQVSRSSVRMNTAVAEGYVVVTQWADQLIPLFLGSALS